MKGFSKNLNKRSKMKEIQKTQMKTTSILEKISSNNKGT